MSLEERDYSLDTVGGAMIVYMLFMHCCQFTDMMDWKGMECLQTIFVGFMAWFFFKSGMFYNPTQNVKDVLHRTGPKLLRPYVAFSIIGYFVYCIVLWNRGDADWKHYTFSIVKNILFTGSFGGAMPLWFLVTLFSVKLLSPIIVGKYRYGGGICGLIGLGCSYISGNLIDLQPYYIFNFFPAMFFYWLGSILKERQYDKRVLFLSAMVFLALFAYPSHVDFRVNHLNEGLYLLFLLHSTAAIVVFNNVAKMFGRKQGFLTKIGRQSMYWYCAHWSLLLIINLLLSNMIPSLSGYFLLFLTFTILVILLYIMKPVFYSLRVKILMGL